MTGASRIGAWASAQLSDVTRVVRGRVKPLEHPELPYIGMDNVEPHTMRILGTVPSATMKSASVLFQPGDVLYGRLRPYLNKVIAPEFEGLASAEFIPLTMPPGVVPAFIQYRLNASDFVSYASHLDEGDRPRVDYEQIGAFTFDLPPSGEQHRIVEAIESYFTRLDDAVANLERVQRNLKRYRASVLKSAVEGRLVPTEAGLARAEGRDYEPASVLLDRILAERRRRWEEAELAKMKAKGKPPKNDKWKAKYKEPVEPHTSEKPRLPKGWCWTSVEQLGFVASGQTPKGVTTAGARAGDIPWFRVGDMNTEGNEVYMRVGQDWLSHKQVSDLGLHVRPAGTILFPKRGGAIKTNKKRLLVVPSAYDLNTMGIVPIPSVGPYLWMWFMGLDLGPLADGSNVPQLNHGDIAPLPVPLPPLSEQQRVIEEAKRMMSIQEDVERVASDNAQRANRLRQSILKWAFQGSLVDQNPGDEPALTLIERIKSEREAPAVKKPSTRARQKAKTTKP